MNRLARALLWIYRNCLSPYMLHGCRFVPSCSGYARESVNSFGVWRALPRIAGRLGRCRPFGPAGYDPVVKP